MRARGIPLPVITISGWPSACSRSSVETVLSLIAPASSISVLSISSTIQIFISTHSENYTSSRLLTQLSRYSRRRGVALRSDSVQGPAHP